MRGRMVKKSWHDSYHFKIVSQKCLKTAKFHQSEFRFQIHYGILDSTKTILVQGNTVITRSVSSLEFFGREEQLRTDIKHHLLLPLDLSTVPTILLMDVRECNLRIALRKKLTPFQSDKTQKFVRKSPKKVTFANIQILKACHTYEGLSNL